MSVDDIVTTIAALPDPERRRVFAELDALRAAEAPDAAGQTAPDRPRSAHDRAGHLAGSVPGPADLSSNPDHLRGFGERRSAPRR